MKKPILLISKVEVIDVPDNGSNVIECTKECHGEVFPVGPADVSSMHYMNREIEHAEVHTFIEYLDVTPEGFPPCSDVRKTEIKIAMTRDIQIQLGKPFETINNQAEELSELSNRNSNQLDMINGLIIERDEFDRLYVEMLNMSIWGRVKFLLLARVW